MMSRMHLVHNAARLAMADHRAAGTRRARPVRGVQALLAAVKSVMATVAARCLSAAD